MKATGIVRRIDDLGRVVIPREIRKTVHIKEGDPLEIFTTEDGGVCFKPYVPYIEPWRILEDAAEATEQTDEFAAFAKEIRALARKMKQEARK